MSIQLTKGDTFSYNAEFRVVVNGVAQVDYTGWTATAELRDSKGAQVCDITITWLDITQGTAKLYIDANTTSSFAVGKDYEFNIQFTLPGGDKVSSPIVPVVVKRDVTQ